MYCTGGGGKSGAEGSEQEVEHMAVCIIDTVRDTARCEVTSFA